MASAPEGQISGLLSEDLKFVIPYENDSVASLNLSPLGDHQAPNSQMIAEALSGERRATPHNAIETFIRQMAPRLVFSKEVWVELEYIYDNQFDDTTPRAFFIRMIPPGTVEVKRNGVPIQYVPSDRTPLTDKKGRSYVELERSNLFAFTLSDELSKSTKPVTDFLRISEREQEDAREMELLSQAASGDTTLDLSEHLKQKGDIVNRAMSPIGWDVRRLYSGNQLESFQSWRQLKFLRFKVTLRNRILADLNALINQAGQDFGFQANIELSGLPTVLEVDAAMSDFENGRKSASAVYQWAILGGTSWEDR